MEFTKAHRSYQEQMKLLADRGLVVGDEAVAVAALKRIGYYRLSAYTYPLRLLITDGVDGLIVPCGDVVALAAAMNRLARDVQVREAMGEAARARAADFTLDALMPLFERFYETVLASRR